MGDGITGRHVFRPTHDHDRAIEPLAELNELADRKLLRVKGRPDAKSDITAMDTCRNESCGDRHSIRQEMIQSFPVIHHTQSGDRIDGSPGDVPIRHAVDSESGQQQFLYAQLSVRKCGFPEPGPDDEGPQIPVQIDDHVELLFLQFLHQLSKVAVKIVELVDMRICFRNGFECRLGEKMNDGARVLRLEASDGRGGKHDVTDGRQTDDEEFHLWVFLSGGFCN